MNFEESLRSKNLKVTPQRMLLLSEIRGKGHVCIDELHKLVKAVSPSVSLATIYKNVNLLVEEGLLKEIPIEGAKPVYEINIGDHVHYVCSKCGYVEDLETDSYELKKFFYEKYGKYVDSVGVMIKGTCRSCSGMNS
ncbi:MAG: Fur family transcriptional regulator [Deferribacterales bacterium]